MSVPGEIRRRFSGSGSGIEVGGNALAGLCGAEAAAILGFADGNIAGGEVGENGCAGERRVCTGWDGRPNIFANLDVQLKAFNRAGFENQIIAERNGLTEEQDIA